MEYKNFFENIKEAQMRLQNTVVLYDGSPVEILALSNHEKDGIFRVYIRPIGLTEAELKQRPHPAGLNNYIPGTNDVGAYMDAFIEKNPSSYIVRKQINSPLFNKFRPFDLGMYWSPPDVIYVERQPNRRTEQGLTSSMLIAKKLSPGLDDGAMNKAVVDFFGPEMHRCIMGEHPSPTRCLAALKDPKLANKAAAFHRNFALIKGPIDTMFLGYKNNVIGILPHGDYSSVRLGTNYAYCKEVVDELHLFTSIN